MIKTKEKFISRMNSVNPGKLIAAILSSEVALISEIEQRLTVQFGAIDLVSDLFLFDYTDYYTAEMGGNLQKKFLSFAELIPIESLPDIKHATTAIEEHYAIDDKRRINIDPGYVTYTQMVLATSKDYTHRIYLGKGIYAELTYICHKKAFQPLAWTYPDYRQPFAIEFFQRVREKYGEQMRTKHEKNML
jgi:hypothetical protein